MAARQTKSQSAMRASMPLGDFLVAYLARAGVKHIFGLPGDLVLGLFHRFGRARELEIITLSHEPGVGFAADGYAWSLMLPHMFSQPFQSTSLTPIYPDAADCW